jgi:hypothetical protein
MTQRASVRELLGRVRRDGTGDAARRVLRRLYNRFDVGSLEFPLLPEDVADSTRLQLQKAPGRAHDGPMTIGWICSPPGPGSGGHTTLFRMVRAMEERGHRCILFLYDRHGGSLERHASIVRQHWPELTADIRDTFDGIAGADAYVASSWESAHVLASRSTGAAARLYFIQDFEPFFHAKGTLYALAEDSYRFGFQNIALGELVARQLEQVGVDHVLAPFGCDTSVYSLTNADGPRSGVVYYTKPGSDRRGYLLGRLALEEFHRRHPNEPIHLYGDASDDWMIPTVQHHRLHPRELNELYNATKAGLAISFTNITLVAEEMLAAGNLPIVTDVPFAKDVLPNEHVIWSLATAGSLADALSTAVARPIAGPERLSIAGSVRQGWGPTQDVVAETIESAVNGAR